MHGLLGLPGLSSASAFQLDCQSPDMYAPFGCCRMVYVQRQARFRRPLQKSMQTVDYLTTVKAPRDDKGVSLPAIKVCVSG